MPDHNLKGVAAFLLGLLLTGPALAGGGVMLADNPCVVSVGFYDIHFTAYQPRTRGDEGFCQALPDAGETVIVLDYLHDSLKEAPLELRIIRDPTGLGRFVGLEDVAAVDVEAHSVFHRPPAVEPGGSYQVTHVFDEPGNYIVVVSAGHPTKEKTYTAVFPITAGLGGFPYLWVLGGVALAAAGALAFFKLRPRHAAAARAEA